jgi:hypothetical protein
MQSYLYLVIICGSLCLSLAVVSGWLLVSIRFIRIKYLASIFSADKLLVKSHVDYSIMAVLLFALYLLMTHFKTEPPISVILATCIGSVLNPSSFVVLAIKPDISQKNKAIFGTVAFTGFVLTSVGYMGSIWVVVQRVLNP